MGQYYHYFNRTKEEFVVLPGMMKDIERVTDAVAMGIVGYLLFEGPCDGGRFTGMAGDRIDLDDPRIDEYIDREKTNTINTDRTSVYYDEETGEWERKRIARVIGAGEPIADTFEYAGRWHADAVSLTGDYAESGLYDKQYGRVVVQLPSGAMTSWNGSHPNRQTPEESEMHGTVIRDHREQAEPGDSVRVPSNVDADAQFAEFARYEEPEWTDITDGVLEEFIEFVGQEWLEQYRTGEKILK